MPFTAGRRAGDRVPLHNHPAHLPRNGL